MSTEFSRILTLLRKEKGISQKQAAQELGISQALHQLRDRSETQHSSVPACIIYKSSCLFVSHISPPLPVKIRSNYSIPGDGLQA